MKAESKEETKEIIREAKDYLAGGRFEGDITTLVSELRIRKQYKLVREVVQQFREASKDKTCAAELVFMEAFAFFRDYGLSDEERWAGTQKTLELLKDEDYPDAVLLKKAICQEQETRDARALIQAVEEMIAEDKQTDAEVKESKHKELLDLARKLKDYNSFHYARRLFQLAAALVPDRERDYVRQQHALCTYKDPDLPLIQRLNKAVHILYGSDPKMHEADPGDIYKELLSQSEDPETLGLAGAIYKNKWEAEKRKSDIERSLDFYRKGHEVDMNLANCKEMTKAGIDKPEGDLDVKAAVAPGHKYGYPGINAAFVLDVLEAREQSGQRREEARNIRTQLTDYLSALLRSPQEDLVKDESFDRWWVSVTLVEGYFGLQEYDKAEKLLKAIPRPAELWKIESFVRQLVLLVHNQGIDINKKDSAGQMVREILEKFLGAHASLLDNILRGKIGLALSGGGFRASLYHIGVLAKLAELDLLRHVEVISSVSGGSIISAHYYLEVRNMLQSHKDGDISKQQYIDIVKRVARNFVTGTQKNIRVRVISNLLTNLKMILFPTYSRTVRSGELYEKLIYSKVPDGGGDEKRYLSDLYIEPKGAPFTFRPKTDNWRRENKVPILVINATTLNTGNNWQFTASWMGEPPPVSQKEMDGKTRLRRTYYREAPKKHQHYRLGSAVASSACVPGLFEPIVLTGLYKDNYTVRLVDGGVYDNQGISSLLDQGCNVILVSDASGQIKAINNPGGGALKPLLRINGIAMERIRSAQLKDMDVQLHTGILNHGMQVHLKKNLGGTAVDWIDCQDPSPGRGPSSAAGKDTTTPYNILRGMQTFLAATRTDLDSFSDAESYALMTSGYLMTEEAAKNDLKDIVPDNKKGQPAKPADWDFLKVKGALESETKEPGKHSYLKKILEVSSKGAFKIFNLKPVQAIAALLLVLAAIGTVGFFAVELVKKYSLGMPLLWFFGTLLGLLFIIKVIASVYTFRSFSVGLLIEDLLSVVSATFFAVIGWVIVFIHLAIFDKMFIAYGNEKKL